MKTRITMMVIVAAILIPMTATAIDVEWSGSYGLTGFLLGEDITSHDTDDGDTQGFYQSIRIAPTFDLGRDVKVHVGLRLYEEFWGGDHRKPSGGGVTDWSADEGLGLDFGYVELPAFGGKLSVGRQEANWGHGLTTADDRRDRIAYQYDLADVLGGPLSLLAIYDLRQDVGIDDVSSDGHLFAAAAVGYHMDTQILWGLLGGYWAGDADQPLDEDPFLLDSVALVGPFMEGPLGPVDLKFAAHTIFPIDNDRDTFGDYNDDGLYGGYGSDYDDVNGNDLSAYASGESGGLWNTFNGAVMLRPALDVSKVSALQPQVLTVEAQGLFVFNGGLVEPGFDTFSSMIGNAGRNTVNPMSVFNMGGSGYEGDHQLLGAMRVNYELIPGLNVIAAGGGYHFFEYTRDVDPAPGSGLAVLEGETVRAEITNFFVDLGVEYAVTEQATLFASYGWLGDDTSSMATYFPNVSEPEEGDPRQQLSAGVRVSY